MLAELSPRAGGAAARSADASLALTLFLACKSDPVHPTLLQELAWRLPSLNALPVPSLHFLLQTTTLHHLLTSNLHRIHHLAGAHSAPSTSTSPSVASVVSLVDRLCSYTADLVVCHPSHPLLVAANDRLQLLLRLQVALHFLQAAGEEERDWSEALTHALFPALEQPARDGGDGEEEVRRCLRALLVERRVALQALLQRFPYAAFESMWRTYYSACQQTPTFTDIDLELKAHFARSSLTLAPRVAAAAATPPQSPRPVSPLPVRLPLEDEEKRDADVVSIDQVTELSVAQMYLMLLQARAGVAEDVLRREWESIVDGTHEEVVQWMRARQAAQLSA